MSHNDAWVENRIGNAKKSHPTVTDAVATRVKDLLKSQINERQLSPTELTSIAKLLIADMVTTLPKAEEKQ